MKPEQEEFNFDQRVMAVYRGMIEANRSARIEKTIASLQKELDLLPCDRANASRREIIEQQLHNLRTVGSAELLD